MSTLLASPSAGSSITTRALSIPRAWATDMRADEADRVLGPVHNYAQGREIYGEGDPAECFFEVGFGVVRTCKFLGDGRRQIDAFHMAGDIFGLEITADYTFSAEAVCDCALVSYRRHGTGSDMRLSQQLFSYAMHGLAQAQDHALLLGRKSAIEKVTTFLIGWAKRSPNETEVTLAMTRQDIADYLGLTIETVSRTLTYLERAALITFVTPRQVRLRDMNALQELSS